MIKEIIEGLNFSLLLFAIFFILILLPLFLFGKSFETKFFPVVESVNISRLTYLDADNKKNYMLLMNKVRNCTPIRSTFGWYLVDKDGVQERVPYESFGNDNASLPLGVNRTFATIQIPDNSEYVSQKFVLTHQCHFLWTSETIINIPIASDNTKK